MARIPPGELTALMDDVRQGVSPRRPTVWPR